MIIARNLTLSFGPQTVFKDVSFTLDKEQRVGLVGYNGSGKSTLLTVLAGLQKVDGGSLTLSKQHTIAYLPQEVVLMSDKTVIQETLTTFADLQTLQKELKSLELLIETGDYQQAVFDRYQEVHLALQEYNPEKLRGTAQRMLAGLGFSPDVMEKKVSSLSVGWKMRIVLAQLLLKKADFYLFDEPTNHLDIVAKEWFMSFLRESSFGFLLVCHERYFLDSLCDTTLELELGKSTMYAGGYAAYEKQKAHDSARLQQQYALQQKEIGRKQETIMRFKASATKAKMAQSMMKALDKIERIEIPPAPKSIHFTFAPTIKSGKHVLKAHNLGYAFEKPVFKQVSLDIERGQKVALIAPNGGGKTTLFNCIAGKLPLQQGYVNFGHNVNHALFDQDQNAVLDLEKSIFENVSNRCENVTAQTIRTFLGAFLFSGDDSSKPIKVLSGGEKNKVGMVCTLLQKANLLLLDEPTNHLDIPSKEVLLTALQQYEDTLFFVSHDRDFINRLANVIIELSPNGAVSYPGNYDDYMYAKQAMEQSKVDPAVKEKKESQQEISAGKERYELQKKSNALERKAEKVAQDILKLSERLATLEYSHYEYPQTLKKIQNLQKQHDELLKEWEESQQIFT